MSRDGKRLREQNNELKYWDSNFEPGDEVLFGFGRRIQASHDSNFLFGVFVGQRRLLPSHHGVQSKEIKKFNVVAGKRVQAYISRSDGGYFQRHPAQVVHYQLLPRREGKICRAPYQPAILTSILLRLTNTGIHKQHHNIAKSWVLKLWPANNMFLIVVHWRNDSASSA